MKTKILTAVALAIALTLSAHAQVPGIINYQGRIVDNGTNFDGTGLFGFALVNPGGTTNYWSNDGTSAGQPAFAVSLTVTKGLYSVLLGDTTVSNMTVAIPSAVFSNANVLLRVWFNDGVNGVQQLSPDQRVAAIGYALMAGSVPDGSITAAKIAAGAVGSNQIAVGSIGSAAIATGAVTAATIGSGQVVKSVNGLTDAVTLSAGLNITITPIGNGLQIAASAGGGITSINVFTNGNSGGSVSLSGTIGLTNGNTQGLMLTTNAAGNVVIGGSISNLVSANGAQSFSIDNAGTFGSTATVTFNRGGGGTTPDVYWNWNTNNTQQALVETGWGDGSRRTSKSYNGGGWATFKVLGSYGLSGAEVDYGAAFGSLEQSQGIKFQVFRSARGIEICTGWPTNDNSGTVTMGHNVVQTMGYNASTIDSAACQDHQIPVGANDTNVFLYEQLIGTGKLEPTFNDYNSNTWNTNANMNLNRNEFGYSKYSRGSIWLTGSNSVGCLVGQIQFLGQNSTLTGYATGIATSEFAISRESGILFGTQLAPGTSATNDSLIQLRDEAGIAHGFFVSSNGTFRIFGGTGNTNITGNATAMVCVTNVISAVNGTFTLGSDRGFVSISAVLGTGASASLMYINGTTTNSMSSFGIPGTNTFCGHADAGSTLLFTNWTGASVIVLNDGSFSPNRVIYP